ncbi:MAG: ABC transporter substrate-binding protein, partial [Bowdeniella nasicola]|nr:ABC transporter substrate-binding protein [Bowdeniella nasicola]
DPAGAYDNGSFAVGVNVYGLLFSAPVGSANVEPDLAESGEFTSPTEFTVQLKDDLKFANGNDLTSSDVKFSFDRLFTINDSNGPMTLLANLDHIDTPDERTVVFHLTEPHDQVFTQALSSPAGLIVDEEVFAADALTDAQTIVDGRAFAGQYEIEHFELNNLVRYVPNANYGGARGQVENSGVNVTYYAEPANMKLDIQQGNIDVAYRSLSATDIADLKEHDDVEVIEGPGGEIRYLVFNFDTQPFGAAQADADPEKALAVRAAIADILDRDALASQVYKDTYAPLYSFVPTGLDGAATPLKDAYGDGAGGPDVARAKQRLADAQIDTPVTLHLQYSPEHYGPQSGDEYAMIKSQLEADGLFSVDLQSTEWVQYAKERAEDVYPAYQLGWFPSYSDADNYLTPFFRNDNFLANHYRDDDIDAMIRKQASETDAQARIALTEQIQTEVAKALPTLPYLQGRQLAVVQRGVDGVNLDPSNKFFYATLTKTDTK